MVKNRTVSPKIAKWQEYLCHHSYLTSFWKSKETSLKDQTKNK